jgi:hypothetical protein
VPGESQQPVPLRDLEVAQRIALAARSGSHADREPPLEQLLAAFEEPEPTAEARRRIASALTLAGLRADPPLIDAQPGERITLRSTAGGGRNVKVVAGAGVLALLLTGAAIAATVGGGDGKGGGQAGDTISLETVQSTATVPPTTAAPPVTTAPPVVTKPPATKKKAAKKKKRPAPPAIVTVKLIPGPQSSYLCVDRGAGTPATETTLFSPRTFKGKRIRINVGLSTVRVTVNGKPFALSGSPTGYLITPTKRAYLPQGQRPCA